MTYRPPTHDRTGIVDFIHPAREFAIELDGCQRGDRHGTAAARPAELVPHLTSTLSAPKAEAERE